MGELMKKAALVFVILFLAAACGKKEVKQQSADSLLTQEAFTVAERLREAFVKRDLEGVKLYATEDGLKDILISSSDAADVGLEFTPRWTEIEGSRINLYISWKSAWLVGGKKTEDRGLGLFVMDGRPLKVTKIQRANPFQYPGR